LFKGRFFPSEEGGVSAGQVEAEIKLMQAEANAQAGRCAAALAFLGEDHRELVLNEAVARPDVRMAVIAKKCGNGSEAQRLLQTAAASKGGGESGWTLRAQQLLGTVDAAKGRQKVQELLAANERIKDANGANGWWWYNLGILQAAADQKGVATESFRKALLLPDRMMSHHLARAAMADLASN